MGAGKSGPLKNPRHEAFVQAYTEGLPAYAAYLRAGYKCSVRTAAVESSKLLKKPDIQNRRRHLLEGLAESLIITKESLCAELEQARALAHEQGQSAAATAASVAKARLLGIEAPKEINVNLTATFNQMTDDELRFEVASMINEARAVKGQPPIALPGQANKDDNETKH
ncbi:terminase small subunit [Mesorhizobium carmichaelinearum]|uniref:terminase small subunit n=1 Tax=Mesorhizobium carmichaelinearum TaxID=1208188 RepID=UPI000BA398F4|nr:terminase small subunit [Mesorhizobium carmichaelinearum]